jgi:hypothetical protein
MYVNAKMLPAVTVPGIREGRMRERSEGGNSIMMYLIHCKNLCKCYNVPTPRTKKKEKRRYRAETCLAMSSVPITFNFPFCLIKSKLKKYYLASQSYRLLLISFSKMR